MVKSSTLSPRPKYLNLKPKTTKPKPQAPQLKLKKSELAKLSKRKQTQIARFVNNGGVPITTNNGASFLRGPNELWGIG